MESGTALRIAREAAGVGLREIARRTHYSPSYLSQVEKGQRPTTSEIVAAYETALGTDVERLESVAKSPVGVDSSALAGVAVMLATGAGTAARRSSGKAVILARQSGDPDRLVHGSSFSAYDDAERGRYAAAADLSDAASAVSRAHPLIAVYERFQRARIHALAGEARQAQHALVLADRAAEAAAQEELPDAGYWYTPAFFGLQRARVLRSLGAVDRAQAEVRAAVDALPAEHRSTEWAAKWRRAADGFADIPH